MDQWHPPFIGYSQPPPLPGRYYPQGYLRGVAGIYPQTLNPMLVVEATSKTLTVDLDHPLSGRQLDVEIELEDVSQLRKERGGRCSDRLLDALDNGPGMQARITSNPITFDKETAYQRADQSNDLAFYSEPRLVSHIDSQAKTHLAAVIENFLQPGSRVLDLMTSVDSHLPKDHGIEVAGLGMNSQEMSENKDLAEHMIHDLNANPKLPFSDKSFDAVLCNLSIEYLVKPQEVILDTRRVLKPAGTLLISFSNRWFPPKVTKLWTELHEFERMRYILQLCWPHFDNLQTFSFRNWPRPVSDKYFPQIQTSDPLYVVTGKVRI
jgi:SAM-dependent methyltransferase